MLASFVVCYHSGQIKKLAIMLCHIYRSNRKFDTYLYRSPGVQLQFRFDAGACARQGR
jgi:hypothetical protein